MRFSPTYTITPRILALLEKITELRTKIEMSTIAVSWVPRLERDAFTRLAHSSTAIEGNPLTLKEVEILSKGGSLPLAASRHKNEVLNYLAALRYITEHSGKKTINEKDVLRLHGIIGKDALEREPVGEFRDYQVVIRMHKPPKSKDVPRLVTELLSWLNSNGRELPAVISSAILHYQFEYIHPFGDGNGRVGRVLATWELYRREIDTHHIFSVDEIYWEYREKYFSSLLSVQEAKGDMTTWIEFVAGAVAEALSRAWKRVEKVRGQVTKSGEELILTPKQERLLNLLVSTPMGISEIMKEMGITTRAGAHYIIKPLIDYKLIVRKGGHKTGKYVVS